MNLENRKTLLKTRTTESFIAQFAFGDVES